MREIKFK